MIMTMITVLRFQQHFIVAPLIIAPNTAGRIILKIRKLASILAKPRVEG